MSNFKVGDRVRVIAPEDTFGDYDVGSEATVQSVDGDGEGMVVSWSAPYHNSPSRDRARVYYLFAREVELIP